MRCSLVCVSVGLLLSVALAEPPPTAWKKMRLSDRFYCEGATFADLDRDGAMDVISGPFWYRGPSFKEAIAYYEPQAFDPKQYSKNFFAFAHDLNADGWPDIMIIGFPGEDASWFENPGRVDAQPPRWKRHVILAEVGDESPTFADVDNDGVPELVCVNGGRFGYATRDASDPAKPWIFHAVSAQESRFQRFTHGLGVGDVDGDGRMDLIEATGWWQQPTSIAGDASWRYHPTKFAEAAAQMYAYDVDGDGLNDVITAIHCHHHGLAWWRQVRTGGETAFVRQDIMTDKPQTSAGGVVFTQAHAIAFVDMNGDGLKDMLVGKRFWAHGPTGDIDPDAPAVLYWFELKRNGGTAEFVPHLIDDDTGVGTQVVAGDLDGDGRPDVVVGNKKGTTVLLQVGK